MDSIEKARDSRGHTLRIPCFFVGQWSRPPALEFGGEGFVIKKLAVLQLTEKVSVTQVE